MAGVSVRKDNGLIGIDVGTKYIKFASLDKNEQGYSVVSTVVALNPLQGPGVKQEAVLCARIRSVAKEMFPFDKKAAASIGGCQIIARNFDIASLGEDEMEGAVQIEAKQSVSADLATMYTDFQVLSTLESGKKDILFVGVPTGIVDKQVHVIENSGLQIELMDIDNFASANCYCAFDKTSNDQTVVLLNIGHSYTNISVIDAGELRFVRNVNFGGANVCAEVAEVYNIAPESAEELIKRPDLWNEMGLNIKNILRKRIPDLLEAVYRSMEYCIGRKKIINVDKILLTGGASNIPGMEYFMSETLGLTVERWNPLDHVACGANPKKELGPALSVALGLAVREWQKS